MKIEAIVKVVNPAKEGTSQSTGNEYKYQTIVIEFPDGEKKGRLLVSLGTQQVESFRRQAIAVGSKVIVDLEFATVINFNKFVENRFYVREIVAV